MSDQVRIAFSGKAGCGKSTIAQGLVDALGGERFSIADHLKKNVKWIFEELVKGPNKNVYRWVYQQFGDATRKIKENVWIDLMLKDVEKSKAKLIVVDDMRFKNEFFRLRKEGFTLIRIERDEVLVRAFGYDPTDPHKSECDLDDFAEAGAFDLYITNNYAYPFEEAVNEIAQIVGL